MSGALHHRGLCQPDGRYAPAADEWYVEPAWVWRAAFRTIVPPAPVWDPCAGGGTVPDAARALGLPAVGTDLRDRGFPRVTGGVDLLADPDAAFATARRLCGGTAPGAVATNPPYGGGRQAAAVIAAALDLVPVVYALVPLPYLASRGRARLLWGPESRLSHVLVCSARPSMPPGELLHEGRIEARGGKEDFVVLVFGARRPPPVTITNLMPEDAG
ncbi:MAG: hypothetical protein IM628_10620 [Phenylobacterium sp.]|uniref:hypothetical protein n=1 Tax=Phenylobacterium sp. TaxID=1871053 RepID=UPI0025E36DBF|nr:hypothetical protein [Phenylobacterium sp.]MCA6305255.1 hypothetical protein [Phenylobacterium sp.]